MNPYPTETLDDDDDDGTMPATLAQLGSHVIGHRIVKVESNVSIPNDHDRWHDSGLAITLDNGKRVFLVDTSECCAFTEVEAFLLNVDQIDHIITGVGTTDRYTTWHIFADFGDVMQIKVGWSCGNPFYYGYGFDITVVDCP